MRYPFDLPPDPSTADALGRLEFETLISDTSANLMTAPVDEVGPAIETALERIRLFFQADRCGMLTVSADGHIVNVTYARYAEGVSQVSGDVNLVDYYPWARQTLLVDRGPVAVSRMADLPPEAAVDRASWDSLSTRSQLAVPILTGSAVSHVIVIHTVSTEREWPAVYVQRLRVLGEMMAGAIHRTQAFEALRRSEGRLAAAVNVAGLGFADWAVDGGRPFLDGKLRELLGIGPEDDERLRELWLARIHDDDRAGLVVDRQRLLSGELDYLEREYRYEHPRRGWTWIRHISRRLDGAGAEGHGGRLVGAVQDITERRNREEDLRSALDEIETLRDRLERENLYLRREVSHSGGPELIVGRSPAIRRVLALADQVAPTSSTVLLTGETGTGKERFATYIHQASPRHGRAMVRINCSAIPTALIESELFGREKGAYTGALSRQVGRFELADGSTLLLDEIGALSLDLQVKLLRVLQERTIERLGSSTSIPVDVRIIAATNRDLDEAVREGAFRSDLYYRLNVFPIVIPPLRERPEDIPALVEQLADELGAAMGKRFDSVAKESMEALVDHPWPGNVREMRNLLERAVILSAGPTLVIAPPVATPPGTGHSTPAPPTASLSQVERQHILRVLEHTGWRIRGRNGAAELLGLKPTTLEARMTALGISRPESQTEA